MKFDINCTGYLVDGNLYSKGKLKECNKDWPELFVLKRFVQVLMVSLIT